MGWRAPHAVLPTRHGRLARRAHHVAVKTRERQVAAVVVAVVDYLHEQTAGWKCSTRDSCRIGHVIIAAEGFQLKLVACR